MYMKECVLDTYVSMYYKFRVVVAYNLSKKKYA
jgi:hypothetical protein